MPSWFWWLVFGLLGLGSLMVFALIGLDLLRKLKAMQKDLSGLMEASSGLISQLETKAEPAAIASNIDDDPAIHLMRIGNNRRRKAKKKEERSRRLVSGLKARKREEI